MLSNKYQLTFRMVSFTFLKFIQSFSQLLNKNQLIITNTIITILLSTVLNKFFIFLVHFFTLHFSILQKSGKFMYLFFARQKRVYFFFYFFFYFYSFITWNTIFAPDPDLEKEEKFSAAANIAEAENENATDVVADEKEQKISLVDLIPSFLIFIFLRKLILFFISTLLVNKDFFFFFTAKKERLQRISLLRSPFVHKKSFEHFGNTTYKCVLKNSFFFKLNTFNKYFNTNFKLKIIPFGYFFLQQIKMRYFYF